MFKIVSLKAYLNRACRVSRKVLRNFEHNIRLIETLPSKTAFAFLSQLMRSLVECYLYLKMQGDYGTPTPCMFSLVKNTLFDDKKVDFRLIYSLLMVLLLAIWPNAWLILGKVPYFL